MPKFTFLVLCLHIIHILQNVGFLVLSKTCSTIIAMDFNTLSSSPNYHLLIGIASVSSAPNTIKPPIYCQSWQTCLPILDILYIWDSTYTAFCDFLLWFWISCLTFFYAVACIITLFMGGLNINVYIIYNNVFIHYVLFIYHWLMNNWCFFILDMWILVP